MTERIDPTEYLDDPAKAVALVNEVLSGADTKAKV